MWVELDEMTEKFDFKTAAKDKDYERVLEAASQ